LFHFHRLSLSASFTLLVALLAPTQLVAHGTQEHKHHHYKLIDLGTFGGPQSFIPVPVLDGGAGLELNNGGVLVGFAETATPDPTPPLCFTADCFVSYAFRWQGGVMSDLGSLRSGWSSAPVAISPNGVIVGYSENGNIDPLLGSAELRAVLWRNGGITDLGTLPEGGYESAALAVNSAGQVVGVAMNTVPDANPLALFSVFPIAFQATQSRAFLWDRGVMRDLGTLGGPDAIAAKINASGQVMGWSYTSPTQPVSCGFLNGGPIGGPLGSFIWDEWRGMRNLGSFGGSCTQAYGLNNAGQVVGSSNLTGDQDSRAFLWDHGVLQDLGGVGAFFTVAFALNEAGQAVGAGNFSPGYFHAVLWTKIGQITDLGTVDGDACSGATAINARGQVVGDSISLDSCLTNQESTHAFLWENGSIVDLNTLIPPGSPLQLVHPDTINDKGEVAGTGLDANGNQHAFLLIPCDENHPAVEGCDYGLVEAAATAETRLAQVDQPLAQPSAATLSPTQMMTRTRSTLHSRNLWTRILLRTLAQK
jgi:probable HAF family extracellular repeat protein